MQYVQVTSSAVLWKGSRLLSVENSDFYVSVFLLLFSMKFGTELENYQYDSFNKADSYFSLFISAQGQNKQFL